jgi:hypothetical protein
MHRIGQQHPRSAKIGIFCGSDAPIGLVSHLAGRIIVDCVVQASVSWINQFENSPLR